MILRSASGLFFFGVPTAESECVTISADDRAALTTVTAPREADPPQLRAAERLGLFPYADATHRYSVEDHAA